MKYDHDKVDEAVLALLRLKAFVVDEYGARAWKSHDWDAVDRLHKIRVHPGPEVETQVGGAN